MGSATGSVPVTITTIVLTDDPALRRHGLRMVLEAEDLEVVAEAGYMAATEHFVRAHGPHVLVLDLNLPEGSSLPSIARLREESPDMAVVALTMRDDPAFARESMRAGARGYVLEQSAGAELVEAVRAAARGESYLNPGLGARMAGPSAASGLPDR